MEYIKTVTNRIFALKERATYNNKQYYNVRDYDDSNDCWYTRSIIASGVVQVSDNLQDLIDVYVYNKILFKTLDEALAYAPTGSIIYGEVWRSDELNKVAWFNPDSYDLELLDN